MGSLDAYNAHRPPITDGHIFRIYVRAAISVGEEYTIALKADSSLLAWGNHWYSLHEDSNTPVRIGTD